MKSVPETALREENCERTKRPDQNQNNNGLLRKTEGSEVELFVNETELYS